MRQYGYFAPRRALLAASLAVTSLAAFAQEPAKAPKPKKAAVPLSQTKVVVWQDPGAIETRDFVGGPGGRDKAPQGPFTFVKEDFGGSNPKVKVKDAKGVEWSVKFGPEVKAETFATRLVWAVGYFVDPAYFVPSGKIQGATGLTRAKKVIQPDGSFVEARFEPDDRPKGVTRFKEEQGWGWLDNPLAGTKEMNGLKVMVMLLSNWDNKDLRDIKRGSNTAIDQLTVAGAVESRLLISDWGASMGRWGRGGISHLKRQKWDCGSFAQQTKFFVDGVKDDVEVKWGYYGQHTDSFREGIRVADVEWLMQYLGRVTDAQIRQGLEASGGAPEEVECFTKALRTRIDQMKNLRVKS